MKKMPIFAGLTCALALSGCSTLDNMMSDGFSQSELPAAIQVPAGNSVAMIGTVENGNVAWVCAQQDNGRYGWKFAGPSANLMDASGEQLGSYYGPPATWESVDGSKVTGKQLATAPAGEGNIPMQLVKANPAMGQGAMSGVTYIQRINLNGGKAPAGGCTAMAEGRRYISGYTADYVFWKAM